jgi:glycosyltransferase involved in cell wall biosynthesis
MAMIGKDPAEQVPVSAKTIGLSMIVKNATNVIRHCLESTLPLVDYILVVDTGSTDGTQQMIRGFLADHDIKGVVIDEPWRDFGYNRSFALEQLREVAQVDYALVIDVDDTLELDAGFDPISFKAQMSHDLYDVPIRQGEVTHHRPQLFSNRLPFSFKGVLHEYLQAPEGNIRRTTAEGFAIRASSGGGFRSNNPSKDQDDAAVLEQALANETDPFLISRYTFYLAQSYRDCGEKQKAVENYLRRAEQGFWIEEVFISLYEAAKLQEALQLPFDEILATYLRASNALPSRAEALHGAGRLCRNAGRFNEGYEIAKNGLALTQPPNGLCIEPWIYDYGLLDEFAVNAYWAGHYRDCLETCLQLFTRASLPAHYRERIVLNARLALAKIVEADLLLWPKGSMASSIEMAAPFLRRANSDLVTVITPTHDRSQLLRRALKYFREQDYKNIEWQILDDSSSPSDWVNDIDGNIFYEQVDKKMTLGEKRNYLVDKASGDIIVQFDDDDYYAPNYVSSMVSTLCERGADLINLRGWFLYDVRSHFFGYWDLMQKHGLHYRCDPSGVGFRILKPNDSDWTNNHMGFGFSYVFKKRIHKEVQFPHVDWNEDTTFYMNAASSFKTDGVHDTDGICLHILHEASTSRCFPQYHFPRFTFDKLFPNLEYLHNSKADGSRSKSGDNVEAAYRENKTPTGLNSCHRAVPNHGAVTIGTTKEDQRGKTETTVLGATPARRTLEATPNRPNLGSLGAEDLVTQHKLVPRRSLHSRVNGNPLVMIAILAEQKEATLPLYLDCIEALDYPKSRIVLYIRTNNNTDNTEQILREWVSRVGHTYNKVEFDADDVPGRVDQYREHEFAAIRFSVSAQIRNESMRRARELRCDFYFVADVNNFIRPATLRELIALDLPIAAPLLRSIAPGRFYSNYHAEIDSVGYYQDCDQYFWILNRYVRGIIEVPVVHCTYLVRSDVIPELTYEDASGRHDYVVFSDSARKAGIPQYLDNRQIYGYIRYGESDEQHVSGDIEQARALLRDVDGPS